MKNKPQKKEKRMRDSKTATYRVIQDSGGNRYRFFCDISGALGCTTDVYAADTPEQALMLAWESEGKAHFNRCGRCGKWVIDAMYNVDAFQCVDCVPWTEKRHYCSGCGAKVPQAAQYCPFCGKRFDIGRGKLT